MPLGPGVRYRVKTTRSGKKIRLAFRGNRAIEAKNLATGDTHTPAEFAADRAGGGDQHMRKAVHHALGLAHHLNRLRKGGHLKGTR